MSKISNILVSADQMVRDAENQRIDLNGNVQVVFEDKYLFCHKATIDLATKQVIASGKASVLTPTMSIDGDRIELNYETGHGLIFNGFVQSGHVTFEGDIVRKVGDNEFEVENGHYTACKTCPPAWSFSGKRIRAEMGGYAYITQPIFRLAGFPFFWLPYLVLPLKSQRQSGLLFPVIGYTKPGGTEIAESYFWAIDPHRDMTFTLKNYSLRGWKGLVNYRFFADQDSYGEFNGAYINDKVFPSSGRLEGLGDKESIERWFLKYDQYYNLPGDFIQRTQLNLASDLQYIVDFDDEIRGYGASIPQIRDPALENRISLTKNTENWHASAESAFYINQLKANVKTDNDDAVHRMPEIQISLTEQNIGQSDFLGKIDLNYVNFSRNNFSFDDIAFDPASSIPKRFDPTPDGEFDFDGVDSADQIRAGQRLDLQPHLSYPLRVGPYIDLLPSVAYRYTGYAFGISDDPSIERHYVRTELSARTRFYGVFGTDSAEGSKYKHEITPEVTFSQIPTLEQPDHPFFGTSTDLPNFRSNQPITDDDFFSDSGLQFDYYDRILDRKVLRFSLTNTLTEKKWNDGIPSYNQVGLFRLSQNYDFIEAERGGSSTRPFSDIEAFFDVRLPYFVTNTLINYFPYHRVSNVLSRTRFINGANQFVEGRQFIEFNYNLRYVIGESLEVDEDNRTENIGLLIGAIFKYVNVYGQVNYSVVTSEMESWFYQFDLKPPGECWGLVFRHTQPLIGDPQIKFNFAYSFDGNKMTSVTDSIY